MRLTIKLIFIDGLTCTEVLVVSYADYLHKEINLAFASSWDFMFTPPNPDESDIFFAKRIFSLKTSFYSTIEKLFGIQVVFEHNIFPATVASKLHSTLLHGMPLGIGIDSYYCAWHDRYDKDHGNHYCLAIDEDVLRGVECIDTRFMAKDSDWMEHSDFMQGVFVFFEFIHTDNNARVNYRQFFTQGNRRHSTIKVF